MEQVEFWIWEHAVKYGMSKVIERIHVTYGKALIPNSWITALFLQEIKTLCETSHSAITFNEVNSLRQILSSTYKHYKDCLTTYVETENFVKIDLVLRAMFLVLRSSTSESALVKKRARNELFPSWNILHWGQIKKQFYLKDDSLQTEIEKFYCQLRNWLACESSHKEIIELFDRLIKDNFFVLITFMRNLKLSMLERMKIKDVTVPAHLSFLLETLPQTNLKQEKSVLDLLDTLDERKANSLGARFLKLKKNLQQGEPSNVLDSTVFTLPPDLRPNITDSSQLYPSCFESHPSMPSSMWLKVNSHAEKTIVNRVTPRYKDGTLFQPFWFSTSAYMDPKIEQPEPLIADDESSEIKAAKDSPRESFDVRQKDAVDADLSVNNSDSNQPIFNNDHKPGRVDILSQQDECPIFPTSQNIQPNETDFRSGRRRSDPLESSEIDNDLKRSIKRPRYATSSLVEGPTNNRISLFTPRTQLRAGAQPLSLGQIGDASEDGQTSITAGPTAKSERLWQELAGHSHQLEKLKLDNRSSQHLIEFLALLNERRRNSVQTCQKLC